MKIIENLTLDISMTGAWSGDNIKVTAKVWNGKITKTGTLSGSYTLDSIGLDESMQNDEYAVVSIVTSQYIGSSRNQHSSTYRQLYVRPIAKKGWDLARTYSSGWTYKLLDYGERLIVNVPSSTYGDFTSFTVQAPQQLTVTDIGSSQSHPSYPYYKYIYLYNGDSMIPGYGPYTCYTEDVYIQGQNSIKIAQARNVGTYTTQGTKTVYVPNGYHGQGNITFTINIGGSSGGGSCCFPAGAPVLLADGTTAPIESLTLGTMVIGYDIDSGKLCETEIVKTIQKKHRSDIYEVQREDGVSFLMTANHVVLTKDGWKAIDAERGQHDVPNEVVTELTNKDELLRSDGNYIKINNIMYRDDLQDQNVYNIDVEENDTYIAYDIVVHNECSDGG